MLEEERSLWIRLANAIVAERNDAAGTISEQERGCSVTFDADVVQELRDAKQALIERGIDLSELEA